MEQFISSISTWLADEETQRWIAVAAGSLIALLSVTFAVVEYVRLVAVRRNPKAAIAPDRRGRLPSTVHGWRRRGNRDAAIIATRFNATMYGIVRLTFLGIVVPGALLFLFAINYSWLNPGVAALSDVRTGEPVVAPGVPETLFFVVDMTLKGALLDAIEVFAIEMAALTNVPTNLTFSSAVWLYRALANVFILFIPVFIIEVWLAVGRLRQEHAKQVSAGKAEARSRTAA
ncbi:MAG: hypothetical protein RIC04_15130 [Parvibaculum sp.]|uniref:hypothetical protein n=1 Tax=Parvibaculum sp. TaxID=2024848 RepID=UPI0032EFF6C9